jgi:hypothetical protein
MFNIVVKIPTPATIYCLSVQKRLLALSIKAEYNRILREAFDSAIAVLGYPGKSALIEDLESTGCYSKDDHSYLSLWKIGEGLRERFGQEAAESIMERVMIAMDRLYSVARVKE